MGTRTAAPTPADRLGKLPRRVTVGIYLDDTLAEIHDQAVVALGQARDRLEAGRLGRIAAGKLAVDAGDTDAAAAVAGRVDDEIRAELAPLEAAADAALVALDAGTMWCTFRSLGRTKWRELVDKHPPTEADHEAIRADSGNPEAKARWNAEDLEPELLEVASVDRLQDGKHHGPLTKADVVEIHTSGSWNEVEIQALFVTALTAQTQARAVQHRRPPTGS